MSRTQVVWRFGARLKDRRVECARWSAVKVLPSYTGPKDDTKSQAL